MLASLLLAGVLAACSASPDPKQTVRDHYFYGGLAAFHEELYPQAAAQWRRGAELGDPEAARNLGHLYRQGLGVEQDTHIAAAWYQVAADAGVINAQYNLGMLYLKGGPNFPPDRAEGLAALEKAAAAGFKPARDELDRQAAEPAAPLPSNPPPVAEAAVTPPPPASPPAPERRMQIGSYRTKAAAEQDWKRLRPAGLRHEIVANTVGDQGRWYRLMAVGEDEAVEAFCRTAPARGMSCWSRGR